MIDLKELKAKIINQYFSFRGSGKEELIELLKHYIGSEYDVELSSIDYSYLNSLLSVSTDLSIISSTRKAIVENTRMPIKINIYEIGKEEEEDVVTTILADYYRDEPTLIRIYEYYNGGLFYSEVKINDSSNIRKLTYYNCILVANYYNPESFAIFKGYEQTGNMLENLEDICLYPDMEGKYETEKIDHPWDATNIIKKIIIIKEEMKNSKKSVEEKSLEMKKL